MVIRDFINLFKGCSHEKISVNTEGAYCPDCGKFVAVKWYIVRCACCGVKRVAYIDFNGNIKAEGKYCPNCGNSEIIVEELEKINFVDISFAVHKKEVVEQHICAQNRTQVWADAEDFSPQILISDKCS